MPPRKPMLLYGAGGHARVLISIMNALGHAPVAIFDDDPARKQVGHVPVVGPYAASFRPELPLLLAVGDNRIRYQLAQRCTHPSEKLIHPSAIVDSSVAVSTGTVVMQGAVVQVDARLGAYVIVNTQASVDHDCILSDYVQVAPGAILCGSVSVGEGTLIAAGAIVVPGVHIGRWAIVGAGTVVTRDVPDGAVVWGSPAQLIRYQPL